MKDIKLFVSVFKDSADEVRDLVYPVSAGAALYGADDPTVLLRDDCGDNISVQNPQYCELTVQYYAWKNMSFDVGGIMHQRRYFDFSRSEDILSGKKVRMRPYTIYDLPDEETLERIRMDKKTVKSLAEKYGIIAPLRENVGCTVSEYYRKNDGGDFDDLGLLRTIVCEMYPEYEKSFDEYMNQKLSYFCNMFIMEREYFDSYSRWLFGILDEYSARKPSELIAPREQGKLAERLFGVYVTFLRSEGNTEVLELPRAHFCGVGGATPKNTSFNKTMYRLFPPGSRRRGLLRKLKG